MIIYSTVRFSSSAKIIICLIPFLSVIFFKLCFAMLDIQLGNVFSQTQSEAEGRCQGETLTLQLILFSQGRGVK